MAPSPPSGFRPTASTVSVVMPVRDAEAFVGQALESILHQTVAPSEVVVIDDGSTDGTRAEIERVRKQWAAPVRILQGPARGVAAAHNAAVTAARSEWIAVMHADDVALPHRLERQLAAAAQSPHVIAWGSHAYHVDEAGRVRGYSETGPPDEAAFRQRYGSGEVTGNLIHATALFRKASFNAVGGYDSHFDGAEDLDFFERLGDLGPIVALPEPLLLRRIHGSSQSMRTFRRIQLLQRYIAARSRWRAGVAEGRQDSALPDVEHFIASYERLPRRLVRAMPDGSEYFYRRAGLSYSACRPLSALGAFAASVACNPFYAIPRAIRQLRPVLTSAPAMLTPVDSAWRDAAGADGELAGRSSGRQAW